MKHTLRNNPVFWLMWLLPASAVAAGFVTLAIAARDADRALPASYHWEGERLDADFARLQAAAAQRLVVAIEFGEQGECVVRLSAANAGSADAAAEPAALTLLIASGTDVSLDQQLRLPRVAAGEYRASCVALPPGRWRLELRDEAQTWSIRGRLQTPAARVELRARDPGTGA